jgi:radical SAM protein with 4Fe4S-binding SPASM domain
MPLTPYSQLRTTNRHDLKNLLPLPMPFSLYLETTNRCNFKCRMCPLSFPDWEQKVGGITTMTMNLHKKILHDIEELSWTTKTQLKSLKLYAEGEPFLDPLIIDKIRLASLTVERIEITTNGSALTETKCKELLHSGLDYLRVSIYSINTNRHRDITQSWIRPEQIFQNIKTLRRLRDKEAAGSEDEDNYLAWSGLPFIYVKMIDTPDTRDEHEQFLDLYRPIADEVAIEPLMNWDSFEGRDLTSHLITLGERAPTKQVCPYPFYSLVIKADGEVVCCCVDWNKSTSVGNIITESLSQIWNGPRLHAFQQMHLERRRCENDSCRNCTYLNTSPDNLD